MDTLRHSKINLCLQANGKRHQGSSARAKQAESERKEGPQGSKESHDVARGKERMRSRGGGEGREGRKEGPQGSKERYHVSWKKARSKNFHGSKPGVRIFMEVSPE